MIPRQETPQGIAYEVDLVAGTALGPSSALSLDRVHPDDRDAVRRRLDAALDPASTGVLVSEHRWLGDDGVYHDVLATGRVERSPGLGRAARVMGVVLDVTEQRRAEREAERLADDLRRATDMLNAVLEASEAAIWAKDREGRYLMANPRAAANLGCPGVELLGRLCAEVARPEVAAIILENDRRVLESGVSEVFEEVIAHADGPHTYLSTKFPLRDGQGVAYGVGGVATDITDRKRAESALRESEERARERAEELETLLRATPAAIVIAEGPGLDRVTGNRAAHEMLGVPEHGGLAKCAETPLSFRLLRDGVELPFEERPLRRAARGEEVLGADLEIVFDGGAHHHIYGGAVPLRDRAGRPRGAIAAFVDVTDLRRAEEERERLLGDERTARAAAEAASRAMDEFLAIVSHELRTPLNAILGWSQILGAQTTLDGATARAVATIERNARLQARLVDDILDASRIIAGKISLDARPIDPAPLVQAVLESQKPAADAKGVRVDAALDLEAGPVLGDPSRLQQVIWNLVSNAIKFTPRGGLVTVTLERSEGEVRLVVRDTGAGICPKFLPLVFEPFRQSDASAARRHGGLGLGLAIVRQLVELHGGAVTADSRGPGQGAIFTVRLPLSPGSRDREEAAPASAPAPASGALRGARVLVVDDEPDARALLVKILADRGAAVHASASATEALEALATFRPAVIVSDIGMPEQDGYWLIDRVRALPPEQGGGTPALALTAFAGPEDRQRALAHGYQMHVAKPLDMNELIAAVGSLWRRRRAR